MLHNKDGIWQLEDCNTLCIYEYTDDQLRSFYANGRLTSVNPKTNSNITNINQNNLQFTFAELKIAKVRRAYVIATLNTSNTRSKLVPRNIFC